MICVICRLFRTTEEIQSGELQWPFWTKLVVVAIGFTGERNSLCSNMLWEQIHLGGLVFMYIQCKVYLQICRKWRAYNRTIVVQVSGNMQTNCYWIIWCLVLGSSSWCNKEREEKNPECSEAWQGVPSLLFRSWAGAHWGKRNC